MAEFDFHLLMDALADAVIACDARGLVVYANSAVERLLGWPIAELMGRPLEETIIPPRLRESHANGLARYLRTGEPRILGRAARLPALRRDGKEIEVELTLSHHRDTAGHPILIGALRDLSERVELERQATLTRYLQATARVASRLGGRMDLDEVLATAVATLVDHFDAALARVWLLEPSAEADHPHLVLRASGGLTGRVTGDPQSRLDPRTDASVIGEAARAGQPVLRSLQAEAPGDPNRPDASWLTRGNPAAVAAFPLTTGGDLRGVMLHVSNVHLAPEVIDALAAFAAIVAAAVNNVQILRRKQAARVEAEDRKRKLATILDTLSVGVLLTEGPEGRLTLANPAALQILGVDRAPATLKNFYDGFPLAQLDGDPVPAAERPLWRSLRHGENVRGLFRQRRPDGSEVVLNLTTVPFPGPVGGAVSTFADVTDRLRLEAELAERAAQFKALLDHLPVGVAYFDRMGVCRASNGPARKILGRSQSEITGATADELFAQAPALRDALRRCVSDRVPFADSGVPWLDESIRYLDWRIQPLIAPDPSKARGALALILDATERTLGEQALKRAAIEAENASRRKTQFLSAVSHDLRTPVNALSLQAELLARLIEIRGDRDDDLDQLAGDIRKVAANLIELINDLLDLTRLDSGLVDHRPTEFALDDLLEQTLDPLETTAADKGLEFSWRVDRPGRVIRGDKVKLARVLVNLVSNAVKFTDSGRIDITARATADGGLTLSVRDTGPGIPEDQLDRIFDEFAQLRNPERDRTKGTGLGLAICRRLVDGVGGRLTVESRLGVGSRFTATYPPDHMAAIAAPARPNASPRRPATIAPMIDPILIVEDDPSSRETLARLLQHAGYPVAAAPDGPAALEILSRLRPALVLLDLMMPGMEGGEVLRRIRQHPDWRNLKVVLLTGDVLSGRTSDLAALNVDGILAKPIDFHQLLDLVSRFAPHPEPQPKTSP